MTNWTIQYASARGWRGEIMFAAGQSQFLRYEVGGLLLANLINTPGGAAIAAFSDGVRPFSPTPARPNRFQWRPYELQAPRFAKSAPQVIDIAGTAAAAKNRTYFLVVADPVLSSGFSDYMTKVIAALAPP